jgi:hypothetical protein
MIGVIIKPHPDKSPRVHLFIDCEYHSIRTLTVNRCDVEAHERR